jgi:hypothetical protein
MDERTLFDRFHKALEMEPRPGAYYRMRSAMTNPPVVLKGWPTNQGKWSRTGLRAGAVVATALIASALIAVFLVLHHRPVASVPADQGVSRTPSPPSAVSAITEYASATVSWTAPRANGSPIIRYTIIWSGGSQSCSQSPCLVSGLTIGTAYTFTVTATNSAGTGPASAPSNSVTPPSPPAGAPVPAQLLGDWFLPPAVTDAILGHGPTLTCPQPPTAANCYYQLNLTAGLYHVSISGAVNEEGHVVVNNNEIDFFSDGMDCWLELPNGVGRYKWTITGGVLHLTLISDPCGRDYELANRSWLRTK